jgi:hypothetical protein
MLFADRRPGLYRQHTYVRIYTKVRYAQAAAAKIKYVADKVRRTCHCLPYNMYMHRTHHTFTSQLCYNSDR